MGHSYFWLTPPTSTSSSSSLLSSCSGTMRFKWDGVCLSMSVWKRAYREEVVPWSEAWVYQGVGLPIFEKWRAERDDHYQDGLYPYACFKRSISILFSILLPKSLPAVIGYIRCGIFCIDLSNLDLAEHEGSFFVPATHLLSFLLQYPSDVILPKYQCRHWYGRQNPGFHACSHRFPWLSVVYILN